MNMFSHGLSCLIFHTSASTETNVRKHSLPENKIYLWCKTNGCMSHDREDHCILYTFVIIIGLVLQIDYLSEQKHKAMEIKCILYEKSSNKCQGFEIISREMEKSSG
jgi:hypothetical protein